VNVGEERDDQESPDALGSPSFGRWPVTTRSCLIDNLSMAQSRTALAGTRHIGLQPWEISTSRSIRTKLAHTWRKGSCSLLAAGTTVRLRRTTSQKLSFSAVKSQRASKTGCNHLTTSQGGLPGQCRSRVLSGKGGVLSALRKLVCYARGTRVGFSTVFMEVVRDIPRPACLGPRFH